MKLVTLVTAAIVLGSRPGQAQIAADTNSYDWLVKAAHDAGLAVKVWTVDEAPDMQRLLKWGVDGLITNRPDLAVRVRDRCLATLRPNES